MGPMRLTGVAWLLPLLFLACCLSAPGVVLPALGPVYSTPTATAIVTPAASPEVTITPPATATAVLPSTPTPASASAAPAVPLAATQNPRHAATPTAVLPGRQPYAEALRPDERRALDPAAHPAWGPVLAGMTTYSLTVVLAPDLSRVDGTARIRYTNRTETPLAAIYLHLYPNQWNVGITVSRVEVAGRPVAPAFESGRSFLKVPLAMPLMPGAAAELTIDYGCPIPLGRGAGNYGEFALDRGNLALAHSYPSLVVYDTAWRLDKQAPLGDVTFLDASLYDVSLTAPADLVLAATGATIDRRLNDDGSATWRIAGGPMRDFTIIASANYEVMSGTVGDVRVNSNFDKGDEDGGRKVLGWAMAALSSFERQFGPYPYRQLNMASMPTAAGGIEYPGLAAVASRLYRSPTEVLYFESVAVHEVAHQWWYNVVGNDQINHPWLDEALSQYSIYLYVLDTYGKDEARGFVDVVKNLRWGSIGFRGKPIGLPAGAYSGVEYGAIIYGRGPLFFLALRERLGEAKMATFLRRYYTENSWRIATPAEFRKLAEEVAGQDLGDLFKQWVD